MLRKKKIHTALAVVLATCTIGSTALSKSASETAQLFYNNIKIYIDGAEIVPRDATGKTVEPFILDGTTYLPVRAVSSALGKEVEWDGATQSVYIGKKDETKPDTYLDKIQYNDYQEGDSGNDFAVINGSITDYNNTVYTNGLIFHRIWGGTIRDDDDEAQLLIAYPLNSRYNKLKGHIVIPKSHKLATWGNNDRCNNSATDVLFYGDNKLLYKARSVTASMPFAFDIDTTGVNQLTIKIRTDGNCHVALTDLALYE